MTDYMETMHPRETSKETMEDVSLLALDMEQGLEAIARLCADDFNPVEITGTVLSGLLRMLCGSAHIIKLKTDYAIGQLMEEGKRNNGAA